MKFLNEEVRKEFHLLPVDKQRAMTDSDDLFAKRNLEVVILHVVIVDAKLSEISVRIDHLTGDRPPSS